MDGSAPEGILYEFHAYRWLSAVRGRVRAADVFDARRKLRARGYRVPTLWRHGKKHPWGDVRCGAVVPRGLRVALQQEDRLVYTRRPWATILGGLAVFGLGGAMSVVSLVGFGEPSWFFFSVGACMSLIGVWGLLLQPSVIVDGVSKTIDLGMSIMGLKWTREISTANASAIGLDCKEFVSSDGVYSEYVVSVQTPEGEEWPIDASSSLAAQREMGTAIAKCLRLPFTDVTGKLSQLV